MINIKKGTLVRLCADALIGSEGDERVVTYRKSDRDTCHSHTWFPEQIFMFLELEVRPTMNGRGRPARFIHVLTPDGVDYKRLFTSVDSIETQIEVLKL